MAQQFNTVQVLSGGKKTQRNFAVHPCWRIMERSDSARVQRSFPGNRLHDELVVTCSFGAQVGAVSIEYNGCESIYRATQHGMLQSLLQTCLLQGDEPLCQTYAQLQAYFRDAGWKEVKAEQCAMPGTVPGIRNPAKNLMLDTSMITAQDAWI